MSIKRIVLTLGNAKHRKSYQVGDTKQRGNTTYIKQWRMTQDRFHGICHMSRRGKLLTEWVVKGSRHDRSVKGGSHE